MSKFPSLASPENQQFLANHGHTMMHSAPPSCTLYHPCLRYDLNQISFK